MCLLSYCLLFYIYLSISYYLSKKNTVFNKSLKVRKDIMFSYKVYKMVSAYQKLLVKTLTKRKQISKNKEKKRERYFES